MKQQTVQKTREASLNNDLVTRWTAEQKQRELQHQVDKLIESAKKELTKQETSSKQSSSAATSAIASDFSAQSNIASTAPADTTNSAADFVTVAETQDKENCKNNGSHHTLQQTLLQIPGQTDQTAQPAIQPAQEQTAQQVQQQTPQIAQQVQQQTTQIAQQAQQSAHPTHQAHAPHSRKQIEEVIGMAAAKIARDIEANCVISIERKGMDLEDRDHLNVQISIFRKLEGNKFEKVEYLTKMRKVLSGSIVPIKELLMEAISRKYIAKGDRIVCVEDETVGMGYKGLLFIFDVDRIFFNISTMSISGSTNPEVLEAVVNLALELHKEGREGRKIGTAFIIGNRDVLKPYINQMILNPFQSYPDSQKKITDPNIKETVKNFAMLDGVFVIDTSGTIINAGAYINVDASVVELPGGYGTRHRNSAAITKVIDCIAVVVSESGGIVSVFKKGKLMMKLP